MKSESSSKPKIENPRWIISLRAVVIGCVRQGGLRELAGSNSCYKCYRTTHLIGFYTLRYKRSNTLLKIFGELCLSSLYAIPSYQNKRLVYDIETLRRKHLPGYIMW